MPASRLKSSLVGLGFVAAIALGFVLLSKKMSPPATTPQVSEPLVPAVAGNSASASPASSVAGKDICEHEADRCACAASRGGDLLSASFPERALQLVSHAPLACNSAALLGVRAEALAAVERTEEAQKAVGAALAADPKNRFARRAQAIVAIQNHDYDAADATLNTLATEDPKDADSFFYLALSQRRRGRYNGAREGFLRTLRLNPQFIEARYNLVTLTASAGAAQEAEHDYEELEKITPVGDSRLIAARSALRGASKDAPQELPVLHANTPAPSVVPSR